MSTLRRRLRLSYSSDEEEQPPPPPSQQQQSEEPGPQSHTVTHPPVTLDTPCPYPSDPLPVTSSSSSEEFIDVSDNLSSPSPPPAPVLEPDTRQYSPPLAPAPEPVSRSHSPPMAQAPEPQNWPPPQRYDGCPISEHLQRLGLRLKREWLDACVHGLRQFVPGFQNFDVETKAKLCFEQFLVSDMNRTGGGVLPENVASLHLVDLPGPYVLQVDEIVNISNPLKNRYQKTAVGLKRCLKLSLTDGVQRVIAMEYRPIQALEALAPAGLKIAICNVHIRHGLLMLVPECIEVLGGLVEELDAARQRLVEEVNKPPRGNRTRNGVVPPLSTRLALAAWPPNTVNAAGHTDNSTMEAPTSVQAPNQGATFSVSARNTSSVSSRNTISVSGRTTSSVCSRNSSPVTAEESTVPLSGQHSVVNPSSTGGRGVDEMPMDTTPYSRRNAIPNPLSDDFGVENLHLNTVRSSVRHSRESRVPENAIPNPAFEDAVEDIEMDAVHFGGENHTRDSILNDEDITMIDENETHRACASSDAVLNDEDTDVVNEFDRPEILSGDRERPFDYLSSLSTKLVTMNIRSIQGKVKCVLTGVNKFQYTGDMYELGAYVDDGTLISEILIDHNNAIGHSPAEARAALSSPDNTEVRNMKAKMRQFQKFLTNFEHHGPLCFQGIMLIEMRLHDLPIAIEMTQGCAESDAWLLLRRLKASSPARTSQHASAAAPTSRHASPPGRAPQHLSSQSYPIEISP
ncbi:recQ-mediated genome instability protein 1 isoform X2 [Malus domestica]|uniref:recQ-mediated genome instability protein 1 isoform X2 n=1 Tax=Malus domestica TaxID=3750 RepID=UPI003975FF3C